MSARMPFGEAASELEVSEDYPHLYFGRTPFNSSAIERDTYLIIGRRGSGKTALAQYFSFQKKIPDAIYIYVKEPELYKDVLSDIGYDSFGDKGKAIPSLVKMWDYVLWCVIFDHLKERSTLICEACNPADSESNVSGLIEKLIRRVHDFLQLTEKDSAKSVSHLHSQQSFVDARQEALRIAQKTPILIALDTLEQYDTTDKGLINATAALIQAAAKFNQLYAKDGIHLKVLMSGEIFPHLEEGVIENTLKFVRKPVYLFWRPKDLLRLICWRFHQYLQSEGQLHPQSKVGIDWENHKDVLKKMWIPYFQEKLRNSSGALEETFYYMLRHTQMRPRQLILICNASAELAIRDGSFPNIQEKHIRGGVSLVEGDLAVEIINSFSSIYPDVASIVDAMNGVPMTFKGNDLARLAPRSADAWPKNTYSQRNFLKLAAELGIIGRVESRGGDIIEASFEYLLRRRLAISIDDECAIHPMFYSRLNVKVDGDARIVPFASSSSFED